MKALIVFTDPFPMTDESIRKLSSIGNIRKIVSRRSEKNRIFSKELYQIMPDANIIITEYVEVTRIEVEAANNLKGILAYGAGYNHIDLKSSSEKGIYVTNTPGANADSVAEFVINLMLNLSRNSCGFEKFLRDGKWIDDNSSRIFFIGNELKGKTLSIIGLGQIGKRVAKIANSFGMKILAYDPYITKEQIKLKNLKLAKLNEILEEADFISINAPLTDETKNLINKEKFKVMKKNVFLINTSRGGLINEKDLISALKDGMIAGAALDVFKNEPITQDNPLLNLENVFLTPHIAGVTKEACARISQIVTEQTIDILNGKIPRHLLNRNLLEKFGFLKKME